MMNIEQIKQQSIGHWDNIFYQLGVDVGKGKHCPCPVCGGKDRFRYDNKDDKGGYICNQCGAGDGFTLVEKTLGCTTKDAFKMVENCLNLASDDLSHGKQTKPLTIKQQPQNIANKVEYLLSKTKQGQSEYLTKKGLTFDLPITDNALIFEPVINMSGNYIGGQFIEPNGTKRLLKGTIKTGSFIWVHPKQKSVQEQLNAIALTNEIIICEGLATGLTLSLIKPNSVILSGIDAGNLIHVAKAVRDSNKTTRIIIAGDNDAGGEINIGKEKAIQGANAVHGYVAIPDTTIKSDWDDYRQRYGVDLLKSEFDRVLTKAETEKEVGKTKEQRLLRKMADSDRAELLNSKYNYNLALNIISQNLFSYNGEVWTQVEDFKLMRELVSLYQEDKEPFRPLAIRSSIDALKLIVPVMGEVKKGLIGFKNGVYLVNEGVFRPHQKDDWLINNNGILYYPAKEKETFKTHAPNFYRWFSRVAKTKEKAENILACFYMILTNRYDWQLFIEITGAGGSGKSVCSEIATLLAGKDNTTSANADMLETARERAGIVGKSLIVLPDQHKYTGSGNGLKAITGGDTVRIDPKGEKPYDYKPTSIVMAVNNEPMTFTERNGGVSRRRVIFHFNEVVPPSERDPELLNKIEKELPTIVRILISHFKDPKIARDCLQSQLASTEAIMIKRESDHLIDFCSYLIALDEPNGMYMGNLNISPFNPRKYLYHAYNEYVNSNGMKHPLTLTTFGKSIIEALKENGKTYQKKRNTQGIRTNLTLDVMSSIEWASKLDTEDK